MIDLQDAQCTVVNNQIVLIIREILGRKNLNLIHFDFFPFIKALIKYITKVNFAYKIVKIVTAYFVFAFKVSHT